MILCDIGNTYLHFYDFNKIWKNLPNNIDKKFLNSDIYYISVNSENEQKLLKKHKKSYNMAKIIELNTSYHGLGIDRKAACVCIQDGVIIDAGTAITIDVMENGIHKGGYILPGLASYTKSYKNISLALDKQINFGIDLDMLPNDTQSAISFGVMRSIILSIKDTIRDKKAYFTGGDGKFLAKFFEKEGIYNEMLVFNGMSFSIERALQKHKEKK